MTEYCVGRWAPSTSLRANGSRERAPDDRLREVIHAAAERKAWIASSQELLAMTRRQRRLPTPSLQPRRSPTAARGGGSTPPRNSNPTKPINPPPQKKGGLLRRFPRPPLFFGGQTTPRTETPR